MSNKSKRSTIIKRIVAGAAVAIVVLDLFAGNYLVTFALSRASASGVAVAPTPTISEDTQDTVSKVWDKISKLTDEWVDSAKKTYDACPTQKDLYVVEGAGHGQSLYLNPDLYFEKVFSFIDSL